MKKYLVPVIVLLALVVVLLVVKAGLHTSSRKANESANLKVTTSFYPLYFFASEIGGDKASVTNITPSGAEPHDFEPTAQELVTLEESDLVVLNGGGLESWGNDIQKNNQTKKTTIVVAGEGLTTEKVVEEGELITDPHVWLSPVLAERMVEKIADGFAQADPANEDYYLSNATRLKAKIAALDSEYKQGLQNCSSKDIITSHTAFGYLAKSYGLHQVSITGISPDSEPSAKDIAEIAQFAKKNNVKYIFFESLVSPKLSQTVADEIGATTLVLNPIEGLTKSELGARKDYINVMKDNLANLRTALSCK